MATTKTKPTDQDVFKFINAIDNEKRRRDGMTILEMMSEITHEKPVLWGPSIIGFGFMHYKYESGHEGDAPLIGFSPRKQRLVLYVLNNFKNQAVLLAKLGKHKTGKVCLYINKLADIDSEVLKEIIRECWEYEKIQKKGC